MTEHLSTDNHPITIGARFWNNDLRVVTITAVAKHSNTYADTGCVQTWHSTTRGASDTLNGAMRPYGRLARFFEGPAGLDANDYPDGTDYSDAKDMPKAQPLVCAICSEPITANGGNGYVHETAEAKHAARPRAVRG